MSGSLFIMHSIKNNIDLSSSSNKNSAFSFLPSTPINSRFGIKFYSFSSASRTHPSPTVKPFFDDQTNIKCFETPEKRVKRIERQEKSEKKGEVTELRKRKEEKRVGEEQIKKRKLIMKNDKRFPTKDRFCRKIYYRNYQTALIN